MSQTSASNAIRGGIPWWLWAMIILITVAIGIGTVATIVPSDPKALYTEALGYHENGENEKFDVAIQKLGQHPEYAAHVQLLEGMRASRQNRDPLALELFEKARENEELRSLVLQRMGVSYAKVGDYRKAIDAYQESITLAPETSERTKTMIAQLYYSIGAISHAVVILNDVLKENPESRTGLEMRAKFLTELERYAEAVADYDGLLATPGDRAAASPEVVNGYVKSILKLQDQERIEAAEKDFGSNVTDMGLNMKLQLAAGKVEKVKTGMIEAAGPPGSGAPPLQRLKARLAILEKRYEAGAKLIPESVFIFPRDPETFEIAIQIFRNTGDAERLAICEDNLKQLQDLQQQFLDSIEEIGDDIENAEMRMRIGRILVKLGNPYAARNWFEVAAVMDPTRKEEAMSAVNESNVLVGPLVPFISTATSPEDGEPGTSQPPVDGKQEDPPSGNDDTEKDVPQEGSDTPKEGQNDAKPQTETSEGETSDGESSKDKTSDDDAPDAGKEASSKQGGQS